MTDKTSGQVSWGGILLLGCATGLITAGYVMGMNGVPVGAAIGFIVGIYFAFQAGYETRYDWGAAD